MKTATITKLAVLVMAFAVSIGPPSVYRQRAAQVLLSGGFRDFW